MKRTVALILAAGKGTRMGGELPKPLIKLNQKPLLHHVLDTVKKIPNLHPAVVIGHQGEMIKESLPDFEGDFIEQGEPLGTGHALMVARGHLLKAQRILVLYADMPFVSAETLGGLLRVGESKTAEVVIGTVLIDGELFSDYGRIVRDQNNLVLRIVEKKNATPEELAIREVNAGFYCLDGDFVKNNIGRLRPNSVTNEYYLTDIVEVALKAGCKVETFEIPKNEAIGFNTQDQLAEFV
ncbi:MAG: NTP transferase domain-containing protein [Candidatus Paceibacterota bacterium]